MLQQFLNYASPVLVAVLALGSLTGLPETSVTLDAMSDVQLVDDQSRNMSTLEADASPMATDFTGPMGPKPWCPVAWTCDWETWYPNRAACQAVCGVGNCDQDFMCDGTCTCE